MAESSDDEQAVHNVTETGRKKKARRKTARMFSCKNCERFWWEKVKTDNEVSKCKMCNTVYDPIPRENEWGFGKFECTSTCKNIFSGYGEMSVTKSICYKCSKMVLIKEMLPPRRNREKKTDNAHSCNGNDCHQKEKCQGSLIKNKDLSRPTCVHPKAGHKILTYSNKHE